MKIIIKTNILNNQEWLMDRQHDSSIFRPDSDPTNEFFENLIASSFSFDQIHYFDDEELDTQQWSYSHLKSGFGSVLEPKKTVIPEHLNSDEIKKKLVGAFNHLATVHNVENINLANEIIREIASG